MIITKLCIILVIFAKHCDPPLLTCRQLLYFTTAGHAMLYLLYLTSLTWPQDESSKAKLVPFLHFDQKSEKSGQWTSSS